MPSESRVFRRSVGSLLLPLFWEPFQGCECLDSWESAGELAEKWFLLHTERESAMSQARAVLTWQHVVFLELECKATLQR